MRHYYNANAKPLPKLELGEIVRIQNHRSGKLDLLREVAEIHPRGRCCAIRIRSGRVLRRNLKFLRRAQTNIIEESPAIPPQKQPSPFRFPRIRRRPIRYAIFVRFDQRSILERGHLILSIMVPHASSYRVTPTQT
ncbi:unnamed protein product [Orchesella dallaii]|uniref:Uncharacterized protein n=1 Tax=Orchesella dallaii TaxID=48710 RepID=A0ABP1R1B2_9HEXA